MKAKFGFFCICGAAMTGSISPEGQVRVLESSFDRIHFGDGHWRTDAATARNARRRQEAQIDRETKAMW